MVIEKDGVKYACLSCIRGHRVKKCQHHDRQLAPLSKRGRQISQCNHCRDLRSSGSHVKCTCASASVLNRLNGCLCEISQTCTCVARHLQNIQTTTPVAENDSVSISAPPYYHPSLSPSLSTTTAATAATATANDPSITNYPSPSFTSFFNDLSMYCLPSDLPVSSSRDASQDLPLHTSHDQQKSASLLAMSTSPNANPVSSSSSTSPSSHQPLSQHHNIQRSPANTCQALTSTSTPPAERNLIDIFLHEDIDNLLLL